MTKLQIYIIRQIPNSDTKFQQNIVHSSDDCYVIKSLLHKTKYCIGRNTNHPFEYKTKRIRVLMFYK